MYNLVQLLNSFLVICWDIVAVGTVHSTPLVLMIVEVIPYRSSFIILTMSSGIGSYGKLRWSCVKAVQNMRWDCLLLKYGWFGVFGDLLGTHWKHFIRVARIIGVLCKYWDSQWFICSSILHPYTYILSFWWLNPPFTLYLTNSQVVVHCSLHRFTAILRVSF